MIRQYIIVNIYSQRGTPILSNCEQMNPYPMVYTVKVERPSTYHVTWLARQWHDMIPITTRRLDSEFFCFCFCFWQHRFRVGLLRRHTRPLYIYLIYYYNIITQRSNPTRASSSSSRAPFQTHVVCGSGFPVRLLCAAATSAVLAAGAELQRASVPQFRLHRREAGDEQGDRGRRCLSQARRNKPYLRYLWCCVERIRGTHAGEEAW